MTHPDRIAEAGHDREAETPEERDQHLGSENPHRAPVKETNDPSHVDLPDIDQNRGRRSKEVRDRARRDMR
jgi:hypothetical protein